jgi:hypothetical protein
VSCTRVHEELGGSQLGGAPPTGTQEGGGMQPGGSQLPGVPPAETQAGGGTQPSPGGLQGSSHQVAGSAAMMATPPSAADARCR